jgi:hypothetical protein
VTRSCDASASNICPNKHYHCAMCAGVASCHFGRYVVYFRDAGATLPVKLRSGGVRLIPWGRRRYQRGSLPVGACAEWESIKAGAWVSYQPIPVKLAVDHYMRDLAGFHDWFELTAGQYLQGVVARCAMSNARTWSRCDAWLRKGKPLRESGDRLSRVRVLCRDLRFAKAAGQTPPADAYRGA